MEEIVIKLIDKVDPATISEDEIEESKQMMKQQSVSTILKKMQERIDKWRGQNLNCGITGASGCGKSSFINAMRNLLAEDKGAAKVDVNEATMEPTPYQDPSNPKIYYWDLPGVGTPKFPKDKTYLTKIGFERYDFFLIISAVRFTENDIWLAKQIESAKKKFYFVRTKLDQDLRNNKRNYPKTYDELTVREKIKNTTVECLKNHGFEDPKVYLISNINQKLYDFPRLITELADSLPAHKKEAMTLSIHAFSKEILLEKKKILEESINHWSWISALSGAVQKPGVSVTADVTLIMKFISHCRQQLALEEDDLNKYKLSEEKIDFMEKISSKESIAKLLDLFPRFILAGKAAIYIPLIGRVAAGCISYITTRPMLSSLLNEMLEVSIELMEKKFDAMMEEDEY